MITEDRQGRGKARLPALFLMLVLTGCATSQRSGDGGGKSWSNPITELILLPFKMIEAFASGFAEGMQGGQATAQPAAQFYPPPTYGQARAAGPAIHTGQPRSARDAVVQQIAAQAATNITLALDPAGLERALGAVTPADALQAAEQVDARILRSAIESHDSDARERVERVANRLLGKLHNKAGNYSVRVLESDQLNAFTTGGRYIYVYTGLLNSIQDDDELAGILGHEIAHIDAGHIGRSVGQASWMGLGALIAFVGVKKDDRGKVVQGFQAGRATFSRGYESEADVLGAIYAARAGYGATGLAEFFDRLAAQNAGRIASPWLIDHPFDHEREARVLAVAEYIEGRGRLYDPIASSVIRTLEKIEGASIGEN